MDKRIDAYMSVEASVIFSITVFLFYLVIMSASLLLGRCLSAQNDYVIALRGATFGNGEEGYGEVIYGNESSFDRKSYMLQRLSRVSDLYIFFPTKEMTADVTGSSVVVYTGGKGKIGINEYECECRMNNPVMRIRENRN